jgi:predicted ATPase
VIDLLAGLVDKSMVILATVETGSKTAASGRYRMLETIRQYAHDRLLESGLGEAVRDRHLAYFLQMIEEIGPRLRGETQVSSIRLVENEIDNLRLALEWSREGHVIEGLRIASALKWFWHIRGRSMEGGQWYWSMPCIFRAKPADRTGNSG